MRLTPYASNYSLQRTKANNTAFKGEKEEINNLLKAMFNDSSLSEEAKNKLIDAGIDTNKAKESTFNRLKQEAKKKLTPQELEILKKIKNKLKL